MRTLPGEADVDSERTPLRWRFKPLSESERLPVSSVTGKGKSDPRRAVAYLLFGISFFALVLRLYHINSDLWFDEIWPILAYGRSTVFQVIANSSALGNHLLNTLLVDLAIRLVGEQEWAVRLPAVLFGAATIPILYWVARMVMPWQASISAALLLAVSYHHIFFSQNARGYTAYIFFSLLASGLLVKGMQEDRLRTWALYVLTMFLNLASILISGFVFASHLLVAAVALIIVHRRGASAAPLMKRLAAVFGVTFLLGVALYAPALSEVYASVRSAYTTAGGGYALFSAEALQEIVRGLTAGLSPRLVTAMLPFALLGGIGFLILLRRGWALTLSLTLPEVLTLLALIAGSLTFYPRLFLLALPLAILVGVQSIDVLATTSGRLIGRSGPRFRYGLTTAAVLVLSAISLLSLRSYYALPKQSFREPIQHLQSERQPGDIIIVAYLADAGVRFYGEQYGLQEGEDYFVVRSSAALDAILSAHPGHRSFVITSFPRALRLAYPDLDQQIAAGWKKAHIYEGTVGDGEVAIWKQQ